MPARRSARPASPSCSPASPASPTRWARCCGGPPSARTSRSGPTARPPCSPPTASCWCRPSTSRCTSARCRRRCGPPSTRSATASGPAQHVILNDPFAGGTHLNDITLVTPCHVDGRLVGWAANRAHHADVGGAAPGSMPADATEIQQEGLRLPPVLLDAEVRGRCSSPTAARRSSGPATSTPRSAPTSSAPTAWPRSSADGRARSSEVLDYGERRMRGRPRGRARRHAGRSTTCSTRPAPAPTSSTRSASSCTAHRRRGDELTFDFTGTDPQQPGNVNAVEAVTVSAVAFAVRGGDRPDDPGQRRLAAAGAGRGAAGHGRGRRGRPPPSAPATSRSASGSPTSASARWPRPCPAGSAPPARGR